MSVTVAHELGYGDVLWFTDELGRSSFRIRSPLQFSFMQWMDLINCKGESFAGLSVERRVNANTRALDYVLSYAESPTHRTDIPLRVIAQPLKAAICDLASRYQWGIQV